MSLRLHCQQPSDTSIQCSSLISRLPFPSDEGFLLKINDSSLFPASPSSPSNPFTSPVLKIPGSFPSEARSRSSCQAYGSIGHQRWSFETICRFPTDSFPVPIPRLAFIHLVCSRVRHPDLPRFRQLPRLRLFPKSHIGHIFHSCRLFCMLDTERESL